VGGALIVLPLDVHLPIQCTEEALDHEFRLGPGLVVFVIVTDGQENSSKEYTKPQIKEMIEHQRNVYSWQFTFLGANQDAFAEAERLGISVEGTANFSTRKAKHAFAAAAANVGRMRSAKAAGETVFCAFNTDEREEMDDTRKAK
jgi:hypothetical protein